MQMLGDVFSALTVAVGAADKVLELMQRKPLVSLKSIHLHDGL